MTLFQSNNKLNIDSLKRNLKSIEVKIPSAATADNQLADKAYVDNSLSDHISSLTAAFNGSYATYADLVVATGMNKNDYAIVLADENHNNECWRYKYDGTEWKIEYRVNETALTIEQNNALNSGITAEIVSNLNDIIPNTATSDNKLATIDDITTLGSSTTINLDSKMDKTNPKGTGSVAINADNVNDKGIAIGTSEAIATASGNYTVAIGPSVSVSGDSSAALGFGNSVSGVNSYAFGKNNNLPYDGSVAIGSDNVSSNSSEETYTFGHNLTALKSQQFVLGKYNDTTGTRNLSFVIGNGVNGFPSNSLAIDDNGNLIIRGTVYINADSNSDNGISLSDLFSKNNSLKFSGKLTAGQTSLVIEDSQITEDMWVDVYTSLYGLNPSEVTVETGKVTIKFEEAYDQDISVGVKLDKSDSSSNSIGKKDSLKIFGVLTAGQKSLVIENNQITDNMWINMYTSLYGINPSEVVIETGKVTISFDEAYDQDINIGVKLEAF